MLTKAVGKFLGKTFTMGMVKVMSGKGKVTTAVGNLVREKQIVRIPIGSNKEVFKRAFPQFEDFMFTLRHDSYKGQGLKTKDFGHLTGITSDGKEIVLMRQNKQNSAFSDIENWIIKLSTPAAAVAVGTGIFMKKFSFGDEERIRTGKKLIRSSLFSYAFILAIDLILAAIKSLVG